MAAVPPALAGDRAFQDRLRELASLSTTEHADEIRDHLDSDCDKTLAMHPDDWRNELDDLIEHTEGIRDDWNAVIDHLQLIRTAGPSPSPRPQRQRKRKKKEAPPK